MSDVTRITAIEQARAARLLAILHEINAEISDGAPRMNTVAKYAARHNGEEFTAPNGEKGTLRLSCKNLYRIFNEWEANPQAWSLVRKWSGGRTSIPSELVAEIRRRATQSGIPTASVAINSILKDWASGVSIPGVGTWREWWHANHASKPAPDRAPKFPWHPNTLYRYLPKKESALRAAGNLGISAALDYLVSVERDSSLLKPGEVYVLDDVRLDIVCHDVLTGKLTEARAYIMMDWGTRRIVAYTMRAGNALIEADVRALIARGLSSGGIRPVGEITHIFLERGTVALGEAAENLLTMLSDGRVKIHRTGMIGGERWKGAGADKPVGNFRGKAVIEVFMRKLHIMLGGLQGQRGNRYENQPRNLDFDGQKRNRRNGTLGEYSEALAMLEKDSKGRLRLELPYLWETELEEQLAAAIKEYNAARGHNMQGFGTVTVAVTPEGQFIELPDHQRLALTQGESDESETTTHAA